MIKASVTRKLLGFPNPDHAFGEWQSESLTRERDTGIAVTLDKYGGWSYILTEKEYREFKELQNE